MNIMSLKCKWEEEEVEIFERGGKTTAIISN